MVTVIQSIRKAAREAVEKLYENRATISRHKKTKKLSGETIQGLQVIYEDIPCRISQKALGSNGQTEAQNEVRYENKLFLAPEIEIFQGDVIEVTRGGITRAYTTGEPYFYPTHQEIVLQRVAKA